MIGDAIVLFVARDTETGKSYKVPEMRLTEHDDVLTAADAYEIGHSIKKMSQKKA